MVLIQGIQSIQSCSPAAWRLMSRVFILLSVVAAVAALHLSADRSAAQVREGALLVELDACDPSAGSEVWKNSGSLGAFQRVGSPKAADVAGVRAVVFDGIQDAYRGPRTVPALEGAGPRTIEVWAF